VVRLTASILAEAIDRIGPRNLSIASATADDDF
jgi:hypothetical protein